MLNLRVSEETLSAAGNDIDNQFSVAKKLVTEWLMAEAWKIQENPGGTNTAWVIVAEDNKQKKLVFAQFNKRPDFVHLHARVNLPEDLSRQVSNLDPAKRDEILWELRFQLLNMGLKFSGVEAKLERVRMHTRLYLEDLTRNEFIRTVGTIQDSVLVIQWVIHKHLGQPEPPGEPPAFVM